MVQAVKFQEQWVDAVVRALAHDVGSPACVW